MCKQAAVSQISHRPRFRSVRRNIQYPFHGVGGVITLMVLGTLAACSDPTTSVSARVSPAEVLWQLQAEPHGITMAVGQGPTVTTTVLNILGEPLALPDSSIVSFRSLDSSRVIITPDGVVTAFKATTVAPGRGQIAPVRVIATLTHGPVVKADTIYVAVTDTAPSAPPHRVSVAPTVPYPEDSTWSMGATLRVIPVSMWTTTGDTIPNPFLFLYTERRRKRLSEQLTPNSRTMLFRRNPPGRFWIHASGWAYGVTFRDSAEYIQMDVALAVYTVKPNPANPSSALPLRHKDGLSLLPPCGYIQVTNEFPVPIDMKFDDADATAVCDVGDESGDVVALPPSQSATRRTRATGTYRWSIRRTAGPSSTPLLTGTIRVRAHTEF